MKHTLTDIGLISEWDYRSHYNPNFVEICAEENLK